MYIYVYECIDICVFIWEVLSSKEEGILREERHQEGSLWGGRHKPSRDGWERVARTKGGQE